jgi:hypothetical protein
MGVQPAVTLAEAARRLGVTAQRVSQLLNLGQLSGPSVGPGRARKNAQRVWESSLRGEIARRSRNKGSKPRATTSAAQARASAREAAAMEAALHMKVRLDDARDELRRERQANQRLTRVLAAVTAELQAAQSQADRLDDIAAGYSAALTELLIPDGPDLGRGRA